MHACTHMPHPPPTCRTHPLTPHSHPLKHYNHPHPPTSTLTDAAFLQFTSRSNTLLSVTHYRWGETVYTLTHSLPHTVGYINYLTHRTSVYYGSFHTLYAAYGPQGHCMQHTAHRDTVCSIRPTRTLYAAYGPQGHCMQHTAHRDTVCRIRPTGTLYAAYGPQGHCMQHTAHRDTVCSISLTGTLYAA